MRTPHETEESRRRASGTRSERGSSPPPLRKEERSMCSTITFKRISDDEARVYQDGDYVGDVFRQPDVLDAGRHLYVIHLADDPRGWVRVHDRSRIREVAQHRLDTHPLLP